MTTCRPKFHEAQLSSFILHPSSFRRGMASIWAMLILALISAISVTTVSQSCWCGAPADRKRIATASRPIAWLDQAMNWPSPSCWPNLGKGYTGEKVTLIPGSEVKITVTKDSGENGPYQIESVARYPAGERNAVMRSIHRTVKRVEGAKGVQIEPVADKR